MIVNKKVLFSALTAGSILVSTIAAPVTASANSLYNSPLYPTPDGIQIKGASYNEAAPDWSEFDSLILDITKEPDVEKRALMLHKAEEMLMESGAVIPLVYNCDAYLLDKSVTGLYTNAFGIKSMKYASAPNSILTANIGGEPQVLDPAIAPSVDCLSVADALFSGLFTYDTDGNIIPDCADDEHPYDISEDGLNYTFYLKKDLKWSDGTPLTAKDFEYSWKRAADPNLGGPDSYMMDELIVNTEDGIAVTATDDQTLEVQLITPTAYFLELLTRAAYSAVKQEVIEEADVYGNNPVAWVQEAGFVTSGAYTVDTWHHDDAMILKKNPYYHAADKINNDKIELMLSDDSVAGFAAYSAGNILFADLLPSNEIPALMKRPDFHIADVLGTNYLVFNVNSRVFFGKTAEEAVNIRKAISLLIDRDFITSDVLQRGQKVATSFVPYGMKDGAGNNYKENTQLYTFPYSEAVGFYPSEQSDEATQEAIRLLESAGYQFENGKLSEKTPLRITLTTVNITQSKGTAEAVEQDLEEIGIDLILDNEEHGVYLANLFAGHYEMGLIGWCTDYADPLGMLELFQSISSNNIPQFGKQ